MKIFFTVLIVFQGFYLSVAHGEFQCVNERLLNGEGRVWTSWAPHEGAQCEQYKKFYTTPYFICDRHGYILNEKGNMTVDDFSSQDRRIPSFKLDENCSTALRTHTNGPWYCDRSGHLGHWIRGNGDELFLYGRGATDEAKEAACLKELKQKTW